MNARSRIRKVPSGRPVMRDPRFVWGIALIVVSVACSVWVVDSARRGVPTYQAIRDIAPGEVVSESDLAVVSARTHSEAYLEEGELPDGAVSTRQIRQGELIGVGAVDGEGDATIRRLVVALESTLPAGTRDGSALELWDVEGGTSDGAPALLATSARLAGRSGQSPQVARSAGESIEVVVHVDELPTILESIGRGASIIAIPTGPAGK